MLDRLEASLLKTYSNDGHNKYHQQGGIIKEQQHPPPDQRVGSSYPLHIAHKSAAPLPHQTPPLSDAPHQRRVPVSITTNPLVSSNEKGGGTSKHTSHKINEKTTRPHTRASDAYQARRLALNRVERESIDRFYHRDESTPPPDSSTRYHLKDKDHNHNTSLSQKITSRMNDLSHLSSPVREREFGPTHTQTHKQTHTGSPIPTYTYLGTTNPFVLDQAPLSRAGSRHGPQYFRDMSIEPMRSPTKLYSQTPIISSSLSSPMLAPSFRRVVSEDQPGPSYASRSRYTVHSTSDSQGSNSSRGKAATQLHRSRSSGEGEGDIDRHSFMSPPARQTRSRSPIR
jgi:hypothetical protein